MLTVERGAYQASGEALYVGEDRANVFLSKP